MLSSEKEKNYETSNSKLWKIGSIIAALLLLFCIGALKIENSKLVDNNLKFRYIHANHGIDSTGLQHLETIFHINRDKELINKIRKVVYEHELRAKKNLPLKSNNHKTEPLSIQE